MPTLVIFPEANDGHVSSSGVTRDDAYNGSNLTVGAAGANTSRVGVELPAAGNGNLYFAHQTFYEFDTSMVPGTADLTGAAMVVTAIATPATGLAIEMFEHDFGAAVGVDDFQSTAALQAKHAAGKRYLSGGVNSLGTIPLTGSDWYLRDVARRQDSVHMVLVSRHQRTPTTPGAADVVTLNTSEAASNLRPFLRVYYGTPLLRPHHYAEDLGNTASTTLDTVKATVGFTPEANSRYLFLYRANVQQDSVVDPAPPIVGLRDESAVWACSPTPVVGAVTDQFPVAGMAVRTFGAAPTPISMSIVVAGHPTMTTTISQSTLIAIKLVDDDVVAVADAPHAYTGVTIGAGNSVTVSAVLPTPGRYLVLGSTESAVSAPGRTTESLLYDTSEQRTERTHRLGNVFEPFVAHVLNNTVDFNTSTVSMRKAAGAGLTVTHRNTRLVLLRDTDQLRVHSAVNGTATVNTVAFSGIALGGPSTRGFYKAGDYLLLATGHMHRPGTAAGEIELVQTIGPDNAPVRTQRQSTSMFPTTASANDQVPYVLMRRLALSAAAEALDLRARSAVAAQQVTFQVIRPTAIQLTPAAQLRPWVRAGSIGAAAFTFNGTRNLTKPPETRDGDLLVLLALIPNANVYAPPAQGNEAQPWVAHPAFPIAVGASYTLRMWTKRASNEPASQQWTGTNTVALSTHVNYLAVAGAEGVDQVAFDVGDFQSPSVTPTEDNETLLWVVANESNNSAGIPQSMATAMQTVSGGVLMSAWEALTTPAGVPTGTRTTLTQPSGSRVAGAITFYAPAAEPPREGEGAPFELEVDLVVVGAARKTGTARLDVELDVNVAGSKRAAGAAGALEVEFDLTGVGLRRVAGSPDNPLGLEFDFTVYGRRVAQATTLIEVGFGDNVGGKKIIRQAAPSLGIDFRFYGIGGIPPIVNIFVQMLVDAAQRAIDARAHPRTQTSTQAGRSMDVRAGPMVTSTVEDR